MTNIELESIKKRFENNADVQVFFEDILKSALLYKYGKVINPKLINEKELTEAVFCLTAKDKIKIYNEIINGQRLKELFICSIYLKYVIATIKNEYILIGFPFKEEDYDIAFFVISEQSAPSSNRFHIPINSVSYYIQVKENFNYEEYKNFDEKKAPPEFNQKEIEKTVSKYRDVLILFFSRNYSMFNSNNVSHFLKKNKNVGIIIMPSLHLEEIPITEGKNRGKAIPLKKDSYNFLLETGGKTIHIWFETPDF